VLANFIFVENSPAAPGTVASSQPVQNTASWAPNGVAAPLHEYDALTMSAELVGATGGTLDVYVQISTDLVNWFDIVHFTQLTNGGSAVKWLVPMSNSTTTTVPTAVGMNLSPALSAGSGGAVVNGAFTDRMRLVFVAGSGTSAGAKVTIRVALQSSQRSGGTP
jgi:hypothetical protein